MPLFPLLLLALPAAPQLAAMRVEEAPALDGKLDDAAWSRAEAGTAFTQKLPDPGKAPGEKTTVRILYDAENIYVGVACTQTQSPVVSRLTRRDRWVEADSVSIAIDSRGDGKSAFEFSVNAAGVLYDTLHFNDTDQSTDWDEVWEAKSARTMGGWSAEIRIPLRTLRFATRPTQTFGLQVRRYVSERQELDEWAFIPRDAGGEVSHYGKLVGLEGLEAKAPLELRPFVVGALRRHDPIGSELARGFEPRLSAGLDLKWHPSQSLTLDAALLPDFGQVEADQVILNLTTFEQLYPEKRPFFLEGIETFATPFQLLYTRRIGRAPDAPALGPGEALVRRPEPSTLYGAAKLVGDLGHGVSVGELVAVTGSQSVEVEAADGTHSERPADATTTYKALRLKKDLGSNGHVGLLALATNRLDSSMESPALPNGGPKGQTGTLCPSGDVVAFGQRCFHDAYVGGIDARFRSPSGDYAASAQLIGTRIDKGAARTLLDGTVVQSGDTGQGFQAKIAKEGGEHWVGELGYTGLSSRADYNDLGFMKRQNVHDAKARIGFRNLAPFGRTLETTTAMEALATNNLDGLALGRSLALKNFTLFDNFWGLFTELHARPSHFDDREVGDGAALERTALLGGEVYFFSDSRKRVNGELWQQLHVLDTHAITYTGEGRISLRVKPEWDVDLLPTWFYGSGETRYFATQDGSYLFGTQRAKSAGLTLRSTYTFTPELSLQAYGQVFLDDVRYADVTSAPASGRGSVLRLDDLKPWNGGLASNPNGASGTLNASVVLRWEYRLGSLLYLVYSHAQTNTTTPTFATPRGLDGHLARPRPAEDALLAKLSVWFG